MLKQTVRRWVADESGQALSEYGLLLALIAAVVVGAVALFGTRLAAKFTKITEDVAPAVAP